MNYRMGKTAFESFMRELYRSLEAESGCVRLEHEGREVYYDGTLEPDEIVAE